MKRKRKSRKEDSRSAGDSPDPALQAVQICGTSVRYGQRIQFVRRGVRSPVPETGIVRRANGIERQLTGDQGVFVVEGPTGRREFFHPHYATSVHPRALDGRTPAFRLWRDK